MESLIDVMEQYTKSPIPNAASIAVAAAAAAAAATSTTNTAAPLAYYDNNYQQFPSFAQFDAIINDYLQNLSTKKRDKALVDSHRYSMILQVLKDPRNTSISTAQFRFWVKKMFRLTNHDIVCHDNKPVATRENIYSILVRAHKEAHHGGRDKTSALVRRQYSWIPKELIARFVRHCPYCISRRNGSTQDNTSSASSNSSSNNSSSSNLPKTPPSIYNNSWSHHSATAAAAAVVASSFIAANNNNNISSFDTTTRFYFPKQEHDIMDTALCSSPQYSFISPKDQRDSTHSCAAAAAIVAAAAMAAIKSNHSNSSLSISSSSTI
ncbi:hypothetical protein BCV72DRAFT_56950 [Rhizopus microsporus var. microsporus]|uniref:Integrase zinc-binding domain-containing protein n=2 Tax=Rhizopus microsporus TaxID=58291 RepID=A0A2G4SP02_RHIZD|nr:uncharacterized protein RHIMIDRAFT_30666 [Rhizopus microsporus ATCC 52813]ORE02189.1 hypothetical protein BCV72DRAFT_56950 [Rhizopus microsporus var. microsporus]PHZ10490.1 hypothetical protein RHIMIDRAFT_30666 [Rhizopus microsporus ATCC 52813]